MEPKPDITLTIDGNEVTVPNGTTVLEAARGIGRPIPTLCHHEALTPWGGCRLCVVEIDGAPKLAASCVTPVRQGMDVVTTNERIIETRRTILEFLFSERPHYCMICAQSGDCELQQLAYQHQMDHLTVPPLDQDFKVDISHEDLVVDHNRCVLCGRCVRACRELAGQNVLSFQNRGGRTTIGVDLAGGLGDSTCVSCGLCLQVCPTGAIFSRHRTHYAVKGKPKDWLKIESHCPECGLLCPVEYTVAGNNLIKIDGRLTGEDPVRGQLCRKGRFDPMKTLGRRLLAPHIRDDGGWRQAGWDEALQAVAAGLASARKNHGDSALLGLISSGCSLEELKAFKNILTDKLPFHLVDAIDGRHYRNIIAAMDDGPHKEAPWSALAEADLILQVGADPARTHPVVFALIRRAMLENDARLAIIGPENALGQWTSVHLPASPPESAMLISTILNEIDPRSRSKPAETVRERWQPHGYGYLVKLIKEARNPIVITGPDMTGLDDSSGLRDLISLTRIKGLLPDQCLRLILLKPRGNSAGAWALGLAAGQGFSETNGFRAGLVCLADENDLGLELPGLDFLAVISPYWPEALADGVQVLLPKTRWLEAEGTFMTADGSGERVCKRVLEPPPEVKTADLTLEVLAGLKGSA